MGLGLPVLWMRVLGALVAVGASSAAGGVWATAYSDRAAQLRAFGRAMSLLETEVGFLLTRMPDAFARLAERTRPPVSRVFERAADALRSGDGCSAARAWEQALEASWNEVDLRREEMMELATLGACLGASDCRDQLRKIRAAARRMEEMAARAESEAARYARLVRYTGFALGLTFVFLFA